MLIKLFKKSFFPPAILSFLLLLTYGAYHMFTCTRPSALQQNHPPCPVIKVSMLYGSRRSSQLEAALETHRKYSRRWGCEFAVLEQVSLLATFIVKQPALSRALKAFAGRNQLSESQTRPTNTVRSRTSPPANTFPNTTTSSPPSSTSSPNHLRKEKSG